MSRDKIIRNSGLLPGKNVGDFPHEHLRPLNRSGDHRICPWTALAYNPSSTTCPYLIITRFGFPRALTTELSNSCTFGDSKGAYSCVSAREIVPLFTSRTFAAFIRRMAWGVPGRCLAKRQRSRLTGKVKYAPCAATPGGPKSDTGLSEVIKPGSPSGAIRKLQHISNTTFCIHIIARIICSRDHPRFVCVRNVLPAVSRRRISPRCDLLASTFALLTCEFFHTFRIRSESLQLERGAE